jgi:FkbM family methyltransferase
MIEKSSNDWFTEGCYDTLWIDHDINENSTVLELGGYKGRWVEKIKQKYNPRIFVLEPIKEYYEGLYNRFSSEKITVLNVGVSTVDKFVEFSVKDDSTSQYIKSNSSQLVELWSIDRLLELTGDVDLVQMNIEGEEYPILEYLIETGLIHKFKRLMIEFHFERDESFAKKRSMIQEKLSKIGYEKLWDYNWFFEYWVKIK